MTFRAAFAAAALGAACGAAPAAAQTSPNDTPREKLAQTTMKFLDVSVDPRAAALGDAVTAVEGLNSGLFYNPASMARQQNVATLVTAQSQWIFGIDYNTAALSLAPAAGRFGVVGVSLQHVDYGDDFIETIRSNTEQGFTELGTFRPTAYSVGVGYANAFTEAFSVGGHVKYASLNFGSPVRETTSEGSLARDEVEEGTVAYDIGMMYRTGFKGLVFAVSARNFSSDVNFSNESAPLPMTLRLGLAMNLAELARLNPEMHRLQVSVDAVTPRDNIEQVRAGLEYSFRDMLFLRAGGSTAHNSEQGFSAGFGVQKRVRSVGIGADYAYTDFRTLNDFGRVHRVALRFAF